MPAPLQLQLTDYLDPMRWRWVLSDERGRFLADHTGAGQRHTPPPGPAQRSACCGAGLVCAPQE